MKFYLGFDWSKKRRENNTHPYAFLSAAVTWSYNHGRGLVPFKFSDQTKEIFLDSGGASLFEQYSDYPFSLDAFVQWIKAMQETNDNKVKYVAILDYPCEPEINRKAFSTNQERIEATVRNAMKCFRHDISPAKWLPVLQGYSVEEYLHCLKLYKDQNLYLDYIAIGSMCRRNDLDQIHKILKAIKERTDAKIHLFGLTIKALKKLAIYDLIDSCDATGYALGCSKEAESFVKMNSTLDKINRIIDSNEKQERLF
jgi:hypothetical protein